MSCEQDKLKKQRMSKRYKLSTTVKRVKKLSLWTLLMLTALTSGCQTLSTDSQPTPPPMPNLELSTPLPQDNYSKNAQANISAWQQRLIELQTTYELSNKQTDDNQTTLP